jgi:hypothetical protein
MAKVHPAITPKLQEWIAAQRLFFVATAPLGAEGHVNLSPKGHDCLRVLSDSRVAYLDYMGSGNETSAHLKENGRITLMFCAFEGAPQILRLYGQGRVLLPDSAEFAQLSPLFDVPRNARQIIIADIDRVVTACGFVVPNFSYEGERDQMERWCDAKSDDDLVEYRREHNSRSIDGLLTPVGEYFGVE